LRARLRHAGDRNRPGVPYPKRGVSGLL
jgi:hypothetical protein